MPSFLSHHHHKQQVNRPIKRCNRKFNFKSSVFFTWRKKNVFDSKLFRWPQEQYLRPIFTDLWDPFANFPASSARETSAFANARIDWKETPKAHVFKVDVPGIKKVEVEEGRILQISGERTTEQEEKNDQWHRMERSSGKFLRRFRLPENVKMGEIKAEMENGVLTATVLKEGEKKWGILRQRWRMGFSLLLFRKKKRRTLR